MRNQIVFEHAQWSLPLVHVFHCQAFQEMSSGLQLEAPPRALPSVHLNFTFAHPLNDTAQPKRCQIFVDGAWNEQRSMAGLGIILRPTHGTPLTSTKQLPAASPLQAELLAIFHGLSLALLLHFTHVHLYSDCLTALCHLQRRESSSYQDEPLTASIMDCTGQFAVCSFTKLPRDELHASHLLAHEALGRGPYGVR